LLGFGRGSIPTGVPPIAGCGSQGGPCRSQVA
jgi:hypothetical protein